MRVRGGCLAAGAALSVGLTAIATVPSGATANGPAARMKSSFTHRLVCIVVNGAASSGQRRETNFRGTR